MIPRPERLRPLYVVATSTDVGTGETPPLPSLELLASTGSSADEIAALIERPFATAIMVEVPIDEGMSAERECRRAAFAFAIEHDGVVIDAAVPRILGMHRHYPRLTAATSWFVLSRDGDSVATSGLQRFGLPELVCRQAAGPMFDAVLTGLAQRILRQWPAQEPTGPYIVSLRDIAYGYGDDSAGGEDPTFARSLELSVRFDQLQHVLEVTVHDDPAATLFVD